MIERLACLVAVCLMAMVLASSETKAVEPKPDRGAMPPSCMSVSGLHTWNEHVLDTRFNSTGTNIYYCSVCLHKIKVIYSEDGTPYIKRMKE